MRTRPTHAQDMFETCLRYAQRTKGGQEGDNRVNEGPEEGKMATIEEGEEAEGRRIGTRRRRKRGRFKSENHS